MFYGDYRPFLELNLKPVCYGQCGHIRILRLLAHTRRRGEAPKFMSLHLLLSNNTLPEDSVYLESSQDTWFVLLTQTKRQGELMYKPPDSLIPLHPGAFPPVSCLEGSLTKFTIGSGPFNDVPNLDPLFYDHPEESQGRFKRKKLSPSSTPLTYF